MTPAGDNRDIDWAVSEAYREVLNGNVAPSLQLATQPFYVDRETIDGLMQQHVVINRYFQTAVAAARVYLADNSSPIHQLLFSSLPSHVDVGYHRELADVLWSTPLFFRTDQSTTGKLYELQAPGSGWGDFELISRAFAKLGIVCSDALGFNSRFVTQVCRVTGSARPSVMHLIDNASVPWGMRYFIETTRDSIRYWGYDTDLDSLDIDLIRSHSFYGLAAENLFAHRLKRASEGGTLFDIPPHILFDQKAAMALPFLSETRDAFDDEVRQMFPYTTVARIDGFEDSLGKHVSWDSFVERPGRERRYFLKYGGPDVTRNWGSRAVFRLTSGARSTIDIVRADIAAGSVWLVQEAESNSSQLTYWDARKQQEVKEKRVEKLSAFYGPDGFLGAKIMHRNHFKVHGQRATAVAIVESKAQ